MAPPGHDKFACHVCDTPCCVEAAHLFVGTQRENLADAKAKGRFTVGTKNGSAKLAEDQVLEIRNDGRKLTEIANEYGISITTVSEIRLRKTWLHLEDGQ